MYEDFQSELDRFKSRLAIIETELEVDQNLFVTIESENHEAKSLIVDRQVQLTAAARRLANLDSLSSELRSNLLAVKSQCSEIRAALADAKSSPLKS